MKCQNCGTEISKKQKFCKYCGTPVESMQDISEKPKGLKSRKAFWMTTIVFAVVIILLGVVGGMFFLGKDSEESYQQILLSANRYYEKQQYEKAEEYYLRLIEIEPMEKEPYVQLYKVYADQDKYAQCTSLMERAEEVLPAEDYQDVRKETESYQKILDSRKENSEQTEDDSQEESENKDEKGTEYEKAVEAFAGFIASGRYIDYDFITNINHSDDYYAIEDVDHNGIPELYILSLTDAVDPVHPGGYTVIPYKYSNGEVICYEQCIPSGELTVSDANGRIMNRIQWAQMDQYTVYEVVNDTVTYSMPESLTYREFYYSSDTGQWSVGISMPPSGSGIDYFAIDDSRDISEDECNLLMNQWMGESHSFEWKRIDDLPAITGENQGN